jgi:hypothetical protein
MLYILRMGLSLALHSWASCLSFLNY